MSSDQIKSITEEAENAISEDRDDDAWEAMNRLRSMQAEHREAAKSLIEIFERHSLTWVAVVEIMSEIFEAHGNDLEILCLLGEASEAARDIDDLNAAPPTDALFADIVAALSSELEDQDDVSARKAILTGLSTAARMLARQADEVAERAYRGLVEIDPEKSSYHYNLGLYQKTRGQFEAGVLSNQSALRLSDGDNEAYHWNLGICATGAGMGEVALEVWQAMDVKIELGRFGLPDGRFAMCKVKLAENPLAERRPENDSPGLEETIWIQRLSPCHGIIRSVLYQDLGVDFGDVVLFDGAPITYHTYGGEQVAVFPHLATLVRQGYHYYDFAGTQETADQLADASADLSADSVVYSHTESYQIMCESCWRDPDNDHLDHEETEKFVVFGRIAAPPTISPEDLLNEIDQAVAKRAPAEIYAPALCLAAGQEARAAAERRQYEILVGSE